MADDKLFPYQARVPVTADGALPSVDLLQFLNKIFKRVGEFSALTNLQLEALADSQASDIAAALQAANDAQVDADAALAAIALLSGHTPVYMQDTEPPATSIWFKTDPTSGLVIDIMQVTP